MNNKQIGEYMLGKTLGEGTFGKVKKATHIKTNQPVAIKILQKDKIIDVADVERVAREIHILKQLRHSSIIQLYEIIETPQQLFLITEYASNGELFDYIVQKGKVEESEAISFFLDILSGVEYLHKLNFVHRDLKPENLLLSKDNKIKIADFGLSNTYKKGELLKTACGSPCYAAPEMIGGKQYVGLQVDIWSTGVILFALLCGYLPFEDPDTSKLYKKILAGEYQTPHHISQNAKDLIKNILSIDNEKRFTIQQIREHIWTRQMEQVNLNGLVIGWHRIPLDQIILQKAQDLGYDKEYTIKCLEANQHNSETTAYYLLLKKHIEDGNESPSDISSIKFSPVARFQKRVQSLQKTYKKNDFNRKSSLHENYQYQQIQKKETANFSCIPTQLPGLKYSQNKTVQKYISNSQNQNNNIINSVNISPQKFQQSQVKNYQHNVKQFSYLKTHDNTPRQVQISKDIKYKKYINRNINNNQYKIYNEKKQNNLYSISIKKNAKNLNTSVDVKYQFYKAR